MKEKILIAMRRGGHRSNPQKAQKMMKNGIRAEFARLSLRLRESA
jgi:hypothetical protein